MKRHFFVFLLLLISKIGVAMHLPNASTALALFGGISTEAVLVKAIINEGNWTSHPARVVLQCALSTGLSCASFFLIKEMCDCIDEGEFWNIHSDLHLKTNYSYNNPYSSSPMQFNKICIMEETVPTIDANGNQIGNAVIVGGKKILEITRDTTFLCDTRLIDTPEFRKNMAIRMTIPAGFIIAFALGLRYTNRYINK